MRLEAACKAAACRRCSDDLAFLQQKIRPRRRYSGNVVRIVDLFAGCGGMSIGMEEAVRRLGGSIEIPLAVDSDPAVLAIYERNLPFARGLLGDVASVFGGGIGARLTAAERRVAKEVGAVDVLLGGPPCQGHSDLNNHTRRRDPKNLLYLRMARAVEVLRPRVVVIENVAPVQRDRSNVVERTSEVLIRAGYAVAARVLDLRRLGVPQRRQRFLLIASKVRGLGPASVLQALAVGIPGHPDRTVGWAMADLRHHRLAGNFDTPSQTSRENADRIAFLFDNQLYDLPNDRRPKCHRDRRHSYVSMYGRLRWTQPAQTMTTGFGSMGQGRYVHPQRRRTITPHEAARLQTFPDWFDFGPRTTRQVLAKAIGNAVPPLVTIAIGAAIVPALWSCERPIRAIRA